MLLLASLTSLAAAGAGIMAMDASSSPILFDSLALLGTLSAFVAICSTEAKLSS